MSRITFVLILLLALGLRFYRLDAQSLWSDEGNSASLAQRSLPLITAAAGGDIHPPLYYYLLHFWSLAFGASEFALRALSALAGVALVGLVFWIGAELFGRAAGLAGAALAAINPFQVYYSQEARMYMLAAALGAAATLCFVRWVRGREAGRRATGWAVALALVTAAGLYTHYAFPLIPAAQAVALLLWLARRREGRVRTALTWLGIQAAAFALYLPWLPVAYRQITTWPSARYPVTSLSAPLEALHLLALGQTLPAGTPLFALALVAWLLSAVWFLRPQAKGRDAFPLLVVLSWLVVPVAFILAAGLFQGPFLKFLLIASPPLCLLLGAGLARAWQIGHWGLQRKRCSLRVVLKPHRSRWGILPPIPLWLQHVFLRIHEARVALWPVVSALLLIWLAVATVASLRNLYFNPAYARDDYRGIAADIRALQREGDAVLLNAPNQWEVFTYYYKDGVPVYPVARERPLDEAAEAQELSDILARYRRIFALYWGDRESDPGRFVERWLSAHAYIAQDVWRGNVRFVIYAIPAQMPAGIATPLQVRFGPHIRLNGYTLLSDRLRPGDVLQLSLFWTTDAPLTEPYKVFVHVIDASDHILAQHDSEPGAGLQPTTGWTPGEVVNDNHGILIPLAAPAGTYRLAVGLYRPDGPRLPLATGEDRLLLSDIMVSGSP